MSIINKIFELIFYPFQGMHPGVGITVISFLTGVIILVIYRYTSNQNGIKQSKNLIKAYFLEIRLYKDSLSVLVRAIGKIILNNLKYLRFAFVPLCFIIVPLILIFFQLDVRYKYRALQPGENTILTVEFSGEMPGEGKLVKLDVPTAIAIDAPAVRVPSENRISWRLKALDRGTYDVEIRVGEESISKNVVVSDRLVSLSTSRSTGGFFNYVMNPVERPLPSDLGISSVQIMYPKAADPIRVFGTGLHWILTFLLLSFVFGLVLMLIFKVEF